MAEKIHLLIVEDSEDDMLFVLREVKRGGYEPIYQRVDTESGFNAALAAGGWDAVIADYNLPTFSAIGALHALQKSGIDLPFIIVSGAIGEEVAVAAMKSGAHDYILKSGLARLVPAIEREIRDARVRHERRLAQEAYLRMAAIVESSGDAIIGKTLDGTITSWNLGAERLYGYTAEEALGKSVTMLLPTDRLDEEAQILEKLKRGITIDTFETIRFRKDGRRIDISVNISPIKDSAGRVVGASKIARDITERRRAENCVAALSKLGQSLSLASTPIDAARIIGNISDVLFGWDAFTLDLYSAETDRIRTLLNVDTIQGCKQDVPSTYIDQRPSGLTRRIIQSGAELILKKNAQAMLPDSIPVGDTARPSASIMLVPIRNDRKVIGVISIHSYSAQAYERRDLDTLQTLADYCGGALERIQAREALVLATEQLQHLVSSSPAVLYSLKIQEEALVPVWISENVTQMTGYGPVETLTSKWWKRHVPVRQTMHSLFEAGEAGTLSHEFHFQKKDGQELWIRDEQRLLRDASGRITEVVGSWTDITQRRLAEQELRASREQLRALAAHLQSVREEERKAITREIHDEMGQSLTGFKMDLAWMRNRIEADDEPLDHPALLAKIGTMRTLVDGTATLMRRLCTELRPGVLDDLGLIAAFEWQIREYQNRTSIKCQPRLELGELAIDADRSTALFRIFQEILTNVARHAHATQIDVYLGMEGENIVLEVKDNGKGIKESEKAGSKSLGLLGMRERALILGGEVSIRGTPNKGTVVKVKVPFPQSARESSKNLESSVNSSPGS